MKTVFSDMRGLNENSVLRYKGLHENCFQLQESEHYTDLHGSEHSIQSCRDHCRLRYWGLSTVVPSYRGMNNAVVPSYRDLNTVVPSYRGLNTVVPNYRVLNTVVPSYRGLNTVVPSYRGLNTVVPSYIQGSEHCSAKLQSLYTYSPYGLCGREATLN